jgi:hypothetical protein
MDSWELLELWQFPQFLQFLSVGVLEAFLPLGPIPFLGHRNP